MKRPFLSWVLLTVAVFLFWLHYAIKNIDIITKALTMSSVQLMLVISLLVAGCTVYLGILRLTSQRKAGQRLFYMEFQRRRLFRLFICMGLAITALTVIEISLGQITRDAVHMISGILDICVIFFMGMIGFSNTGVFEQGLLLPFSLVPFSDIESYQWLDDERITFRYTARTAGFRYKGPITFLIDPLQREALVAFLAQRIGQKT